MSLYTTFIYVRCMKMLGFVGILYDNEMYSFVGMKSYMEHSSQLLKKSYISQQNHTSHISIQNPNKTIQVHIWKMYENVGISPSRKS